ncbi:MAG: pgcA [Rhodocyclales bacterium]|nr:pgcA [Rhodocyclales bacterium]
MRHILIVCMLLVLSACGGGGGGGGSGGSVSAPAASLSGLAASGDAIVGRIYIKDAAGHEHFVDTLDGNYAFTLTGLTPPYMLKAQWVISGVTHTLYSFSASSGHANITPLTHMIVAAAAGTDTLDPIYAAGNPATFATLSGALPAATANLQQSLKPLLNHYSASSIDPITGSFAANHTGMDALLDSVTVTYLAGTVTVADNTSGATVLDAPVANFSHALAMPEWTAADAAIANDPDVAVDSNGTGLVVWSEQIGANYVIRARFLTGTGAPAVTLSNAGNAGLPRIALDSAGNAIVVWTQDLGSRNEIWASRYVVASTTWSTPVQISSASAVADANVPDIAADSAGNAIVIWHQGDGRTNHFDVWSARYAVSSNTWVAPVMISDGVNSAYNPHLAVNTSGQGILAWEHEQDDGTTVSNGPKDISARTVTTAGVMGATTMLNAVPGNIDNVYGQIAVAMNSSGGGGVLWVQTSGVLPFVIHAAMYSGTSWQASSVITNNVLDNNYGPHLAFDAAGNAIAVWQQQTGVGAYGGTNRYVAGVGWGTSGQFVDASLGDTYDIRIAVDAAGNATAVWYRWGLSGIDVMLNRYLVGSGWGTARVLSPTTTVGTFTYPVPRVATNASGLTLAIWGVDSY